MKSFKTGAKLIQLNCNELFWIRLKAVEWAKDYRRIETELSECRMSFWALEPKTGFGLIFIYLFSIKLINLILIFPFFFFVCCFNVAGLALTNQCAALTFISANRQCKLQMTSFNTVIYHLLPFPIPIRFQWKLWIAIFFKNQLIDIKWPVKWFF